MYLCVCCAITDSNVKQAVSEEKLDFQQLSTRYGVGTQCGKCESEIKNFIRRIQEKNHHLPDDACK